MRKKNSNYAHQSGVFEGTHINRGAFDIAVIVLKISNHHRLQLTVAPFTLVGAI